MRGAVATYLGLPCELTLDISGRHDAETFWSDRAEWLATLGLVMATFACAPGHLPRWIAIVGRTQPGPLHAVVMAGTHLLHDPARPPERMAAVTRGDVLCALAMGPLRGQHAEADAMADRLDRLVHRWPAAVIAAA